LKSASVKASRRLFSSGNLNCNSETGLANFLDDFSGPSGSTNRNFGEPVYYPNLFRHSYFFEDTWRVSPALSLTLGLRYENFGQPANSAFDFPAFAGFDPAQFLVPNKVNPDNNNFGPSVGFAWTPSYKSGPLGALFGEGKTVRQSECADQHTRGGCADYGS